MVAFFREILLLVGFGLLVYGVYIVSVPAAFITAGTLLLFAMYPRKRGK